MVINMLILYIIAALILISALGYIFVLARPCGRISDRLLTDYAHRGLHNDKIPENSLTAFERAIDAGFGIELDVQLSRDGEVMVFHDYSLERMTGRNAKLAELTAAELSELRLGGTDERIPRFDELLELVNGRVPLLIELKGESLDASLCPKVAELLGGYKGAYCVESFNPMLLYRFAKLCPEVTRGILYTNVCREKHRVNILNLLLGCMALNFLARPAFIAYDERYAGAFPVKLCTKFYRAGRFVWTIRSRESFERARSEGAHTIFEGFVPDRTESEK